MSDELENKENLDNQDNAPGPDELADIKAKLEAERATLAEAQATLAGKNDSIAKLEAHIAGLQQGFDEKAAALTQLKEAHVRAMAKYLEAVRSANTALPADVITGETIEDIDASVGQAQAIADAVRETLADEARKGRVPAGAPTRVLNLDGLTAKEKIALGLQQQRNSPIQSGKGGNA